MKIKQHLNNIRIDIKAYFDHKFPIWKAQFKAWRIKKYLEFKEYFKKKFPKKPVTKSSKFLENFQKITGLCFFLVCILIYTIDLPSLPLYLTDFIGSFWFWFSIGIIILMIAGYTIWKSPKKTVRTSTSTPPPASSKKVPKPWTIMGTIWAIAKVVLSLGLIIFVVCIIWRVVIDFIPRPIDPNAMLPTMPVNYITYGIHDFKEGVSYRYKRTDKAVYFYPVAPGTTITLRFQECGNPASHWDYRVTRRIDGTIQTGDGIRLDDHDMRHWGDHTVTLLAGDALVVIDDQPPLQR